MLKTIRKAVARFFKRGNVEELAEEITPVLANFEGKVRGRNLYVIERTPGTYNPHLTIRKLKSQRRNWKYWRMKK